MVSDPHFDYAFQHECEQLPNYMRSELLNGCPNGIWAARPFEDAYKPGGSGALPYDSYSNSATCPNILAAVANSQYHTGPNGEYQCSACTCAEYAQRVSAALTS